MAAPAAARRVRRFWGPRGGSSPLRAFATIVPRVSQVDNSSDFLGNVPHRRHPGVLHLRSVRLPAELVKAAQLLVEQSTVHGLKDQVVALTNYLWSRKRPLEANELQRRGQQLEQQLREKVQPRTADSSSPLTDAEEEKLQRRVLNRLRKTTYHWEALRYTDELSLVYMAARLDGGFAAVSRAFHEIQKRVPDFAPRTLLDFGSGTGSVSWAAHGAWGQTLREYLCVDSSSPMLALAERLLQGGSESSQAPLFPGVYFRQFLPVSPKVKFDLVVSAFSLNELPSLAERRETIRTLWRKTDGFLVLVENGTKEGHQMLMEAREIVLGGGDKVVHDPREAHIFAPCPHHLPCPRLNPERPLPCNYLQAYQPLPFRWNPVLKEELFSFLILRRGPGASEEPWPRITQAVLSRARHVHCHLCCADGSLQHAVITARRHGRDLYRCARLSHWGDRLPVTMPPGEAVPGE
ncbi:methyltransferase-like protein 17, mitochondrial isoform X1 [Gopherus evgoodei]|uniref:Ribosome assembly protein METTL17, mitochondrial n=1 Tax=Gopherus evgoodei TaxID=1825980 RepID=A0A8C4Y8H0_9SAUR|nr:methyltransferase-like protein 17, mitochondrial isoform X1 [Gopherus evgoodei]